MLKCVCSKHGTNMKTNPAGIASSAFGSSLLYERGRALFVSYDVVEGEIHGTRLDGVQTLGLLWLDSAFAWFWRRNCEGKLCGALDEYCLVIQLLSRRRFCMSELWCEICWVVYYWIVCSWFILLSFHCLFPFCSIGWFHLMANSSISHVYSLTHDSVFCLLTFHSLSYSTVWSSPLITFPFTRIGKTSPPFGLHYLFEGYSKWLAET